MKRTLMALLLPCALLQSQAPDGWGRQEALNADHEALWWGAGLWAGDGQGPPATLENSLGLGNSLTGKGVHLEGGARAGNWDFAGEVLGVHAPGGQDYLTLYRSHAWWHGASGWQGGFEQEPLVWGYGLNGGYCLSEAARPFPRLRLEAPYMELRPFNIPLGRWGFQVFMGRMEDHRQLSTSIQDGSWRALEISQFGDPQAPLLNGYRLQARFGDHVEFYLNTLDLWAGTLNGQAMTSGYSASEYLIAMTGLKDTLTEANRVPGQPAGAYVTGARSASEMDWGLRVESPFLARALGAGHAWLFVSRGSKSMGWPIGIFLKNPPKYLAKDVSNGLDDLFTGKLGFGWDNVNWYSVPSELNPNDDVGVQVAWHRFRLGLAYEDTTDPGNFPQRTFAEGTYLTGFYYYGDPLGNALGGETRVTTALAEWDFAPRASLTTRVLWGARPFRDTVTFWQEDHPGATPGKDRIFSLQEGVRCDLGRGLKLDAGANWERHGAVDYEAGRSGDGFRWFADLAYRWHGRPSNTSAF